MLGGSLTRLLKYAIIVGVALIIGSQLLGSVTWVVLAMRSGDIIPIASILLICTLLQRVSSKYSTESAVVKILFDALAGASMIYLFFVLLVGLLPFGMLISITGAAASITFCMFIRNPTSIRIRIQEVMVRTEMYRTSGVSLAPDWRSAGWRYIQRQNLSIIQISPESFDAVLDLFRSRPMLPVALLHLEEIDFLIIASDDRADWVKQIRQVLREKRIDTGSPVSPLLKKAILLFPILDDYNGLKIDDYSIATKKESVNVLLEVRPVRMLVFPGTELKVVCRSDSIPGIEMQKIPLDKIQSVILGKQVTALDRSLEQMEVVMSAN